VGMENKKLLEVFKDVQVEVKTYKNKPKYQYLRRFYPVSETTEISKEKLLKVVEGLKRKHPERGYTLDEVEINGSKLTLFHDVIKPEFCVPIYFDFDKNRVYVEEKDVLQRKTLVNYALFRMLNQIMKLRFEDNKIEGGGD
jgi:hypothetical protein